MSRRDITVLPNGRGMDEQRPSVDFMSDRYGDEAVSEPTGIDDRLRRIRDELDVVETMVRAESEARLAPADIGRVIRSAREGIGRFFDQSLFADPAFDMLLFVFWKKKRGGRWRPAPVTAPRAFRERRRCAGSTC